MSLRYDPEVRNRQGAKSTARKPVDKFPVITACPRCDRGIYLFYNGGELDETVCCGVNYVVVATGYELVIRED